MKLQTIISIISLSSIFPVVLVLIDLTSGSFRPIWVYEAPIIAIIVLVIVLSIVEKKMEDEKKN